MTDGKENVIMGKAKRDKARMKRLVRDVRRLQRERWRDEAKQTCESCAFVDPMAFIAEAMHPPSMESKLLQCLRPGARPFYCHDGMEKVENGWVAPHDADGNIDVSHMVPCGGFVKWAWPLYERSITTQEHAVETLATKMVQRFLDGPDCYPEWRGFSVDEIRWALAMARAEQHAGRSDD